MLPRPLLKVLFAGLCLASATHVAAQAAYFRIGAAVISRGRYFTIGQSSDEHHHHEDDLDASPTLGSIDLGLHRFEAGYEWPLGQHFGMRAGVAVERVYTLDFGWKQAFVDATWAPFDREYVRPYVTLGTGYGSFKATYDSRNQDWDRAGVPDPNDPSPGEYHRLEEKGHIFYRASIGIRLNRHFALEVYGDSVFLHPKRVGSSPDAANSWGWSLVFRFPTRDAK